MLTEPTDPSRAKGPSPGPEPEHLIIKEDPETALQKLLNVPPKPKPKPKS